MPKTLITLTLEEPLSSEQKHQMQYLLSDALAEFEVCRRDADAYVTKNYHNDDGKFALGSDAMRTEKVAQVRLRRELARQLHNAALRVVITEVE